ncbi:hypothetical protein Gotur_003593 [Gossypium turneri]
MHQSDRSHYIQMWEDRYDYIPTREPIIVPELAYVLEYMPWFRINGKPYLLSLEERQRPINEAQKFTRPIISAHNFIRPSNSTDTVTRPSSSTDDTYGTAFSDDARLQRRCIGHRRRKDRKRGCRGPLLFTKRHHRMGFKHLRRW